ncbi:MAG TPA: hypothetical protein VFU55_00110 [Terracidiphilus sp.]|nr:hypothetical protein [Terracidiphilus sp.]
MQRHRFTLVLAAAAAVASLAFSTAAARAQSPSQSTASDSSAPIPPAIAAAQTIFLSNAGADSSLFPMSLPSGSITDGTYSGDPARGFNEFYSLVAQSGRFKLVSDPSAADLVLELRLYAHYSSSHDAPYPFPSFRLVIRNRRSHYILWTLTQSIETALRQKTADGNFDYAVHGLARQLLQLTGPAPAGSAPAGPAPATP